MKKGECIFLPRLKPHAFAIRSPRLRLLNLFTPAGLEDAFRGVGSSPHPLDLPAGAPTYATTDANQTVERFRGLGVRFLSPDEVTVELPLYPNPPLRTQVTEGSSEAGQPVTTQMIRSRVNRSPGPPMAKDCFSRVAFLRAVKARKRLSKIVDSGRLRTIQTLSRKALSALG